MKMIERIKRNMQPDKRMTLISLRLPEYVIDDLKEIAPSLGFAGSVYGMPRRVGVEFKVQM